jgi:hypothetical protein
LVFAVTKLGFRRPHVLEAVQHAATKDEASDYAVVMLLHRRHVSMAPAPLLAVWGAPCRPRVHPPLRACVATGTACPRVRSAQL